MGKPNSHEGRMYPEEGETSLSGQGITRIGCESRRSPENHHLKDALILTEEDAHVTVP